MKLNQLLTGYSLGKEIIPKVSCYCAKGKKVHHLPEISRAQAQAQLEDIIELAEAGFRRPLILFPETAAIAAQTKNSQNVYSAAREKFETGGHFSTPEKDDPFIKILFKNVRWIELCEQLIENTVKLYHPDWSID